MSPIELQYKLSYAIDSWYFFLQRTSPFQRTSTFQRTSLSTDFYFSTDFSFNGLLLFNGLIRSISALSFFLLVPRTVVSVLPVIQSSSHPIVAMQPTDKCSRCLKKTIGNIEILPKDSKLVLPISDCARGGDHHWVSIAPSAAPGINRLKLHVNSCYRLPFLLLPHFFPSFSFFTFFCFVCFIIIFILFISLILFLCFIFFSSSCF